MPNRYESLIAACVRAATVGAASLSADIRRTLFAKLEGPSALAAFARKISDNAPSVRQSDIDALRAAGHSEDEIFEAGVIASMHAAQKRLDAGLAALGGAK